MVRFRDPVRFGRPLQNEKRQVLSIGPPITVETLKRTSKSARRPRYPWQNRAQIKDIAISIATRSVAGRVQYVHDFQLEDTHAHYQSGDLFFLDLTVGKSIGKWSFGVGGSYEQQLNNDRLTSTAACLAHGVIGASSCDFPAVPGLNSTGNKQERILVGPFPGYNFGPAEINVKALFGVHAENTFNASFYHVGVSFPF